MKQNETERAVELLEKLISIRRHAVHFEMLAKCRMQQGKQREAAEAFEQAASAAPLRSDLHESLAKLYDQLGDSAEASRHRQRAQVLKDAGH